MSKTFNKDLFTINELNYIPGPGHYDKNFNNKPKTPGYRLSKSTKDIKYNNYNPGPGTYESPLSNRKKDPLYR
jgi:hypothetical protein